MAAMTFSGFKVDARGGATERWALIAGAIAVCSVGLAHAIDLAVKNGAFPQIAIRRDDDLLRIARALPRAGAPGASGAGQIDYSTTASIGSRANAVLIDPCTGKPR